MESAIVRTRGRVPTSAAALCAALGLVALLDAASGGSSKTPAMVLIGALVIIAAVPRARSWTWLLSVVLLSVLVIPSDGRYTLRGGLPFQLEPYRILMALLIVGWTAALLVDPRIRARRTKFEGPLLLIAVATVGSDLVNPARFNAVSSIAIKALWLFATLYLFIYLAVSVVRTRPVLERIIAVMVAAGAVEGLDAFIQRKTGTDWFDHLHSVLPFLAYNPVVTAANMVRDGSLRATASAGQPIELASTMTMLVPLSVYLAVTRKQKRWWVALFVLLIGNFASGSRTGLIALAAILIMFLCLRPRQTLRCWPALIPIAALVHVLSPGSLGSVEHTFFPQSGYLAQDSGTYTGIGGVQIQATRTSRWGPSMHQYGEHNPFLGEGYGTRVTGLRNNGVQANAQYLDDQWLGTLLDTGALGVAGWLWLFVRVLRRLVRRAKLERRSREGWLPVALAASIASFAVSMATYDAFSFTQATFVAVTLVTCASILLMLPPTVDTPEESLHVVT